jgi:hypothetical protein
MVTGVFFSSPVLVIAGSCWLLSVELQGADHLPEGGSTSGPESLICPCFTAFGDDLLNLLGAVCCFASPSDY